MQTSCLPLKNNMQTSCLPLKNNMQTSCLPLKNNMQTSCLPLKNNMQTSCLPLKKCLTPVHVPLFYFKPRSPWNTYLCLSQNHKFTISKAFKQFRLLEVNQFRRWKSKEHNILGKLFIPRWFHMGLIPVS